MTVTYVPRVFGGVLVITVSGTPGIAVTAYIDPYVYNRAASGHDTTTLLSNLTRLKSAIGVGGTTLSLVDATTIALAQYDQIYLFDGNKSEILTVNSAASVGATSIAVGPSLYAHSAGLAVCSDGSQGSLAQAIFDASGGLEDYCRQSLFAATYSNETLPLRTTRAAVTRDYRLLFRPKHFPVTSVSAITALLSDGVTLSLSTAFAQLDADAQLVTMTQLSTTAQTQTTFWGNVSPPMYPTTPGFLQISYTAGYAYAAMPNAIRQAAIWLTSDLLSDRFNPTGGAEIQLGQMHLVTRLRGDTSGRSVLAIRAYQNLDPYRQKPF